jgi:hypothetical protein
MNDETDGFEAAHERRAMNLRLGPEDRRRLELVMTTSGVRSMTSAILMLIADRAAAIERARVTS